MQNTMSLQAVPVYTIIEDFLNTFVMPIVGFCTLFFEVMLRTGYGTNYVDDLDAYENFTGVQNEYDDMDAHFMVAVESIERKYGKHSALYNLYCDF